MAMVCSSVRCTRSPALLLSLLSASAASTRASPGTDTRLNAHNAATCTSSSCKEMMSNVCFLPTSSLSSNRRSTAFTPSLQPRSTISGNAASAALRTRQSASSRSGRIADSALRLPSSATLATAVAQLLRTAQSGWLKRLVRLCTTRLSSLGASRPRASAASVTQLHDSLLRLSSNRSKSHSSAQFGPEILTRAFNAEERTVQSGSPKRASSMALALSSLHPRAISPRDSAAAARTEEEASFKP
mmetsp:Transcript_16130/g.33172  ORF Transcript_16130/g.33172 Transcript_16130/m.33172 type:complete len:244 (+) Transcript_16130:112-843(+)